MKYYLILIAFLVVFAGCSPSLITCNNYDVSDAENRHVLILAPMDNSVYIQNASDVLDDFPNDKREPSVVIRSQICQMIDWVIRHAKKANGNDIFSSDSLIAISTLDMDNTFIREARIGEDTALTTFYLPTKEWIIKKGINPDIVALLNSVSYSRGQHARPARDITCRDIRFPPPAVPSAQGACLSAAADIPTICLPMSNSFYMIINMTIG